TVSGGNSKTVTVPSGGTGHADFTISCVTPTGDLTVTTATSGPSAPSSYTVTVDGGQSRTIAANNGSTTYSGLTATDHTVALTDVPTIRSVSGGNSKTVTVPSGGTGHADFTISCVTPTGDLTVTTATTGPSAPSSYTVTVDGGQSRTIAANNGSTTYNGLSATDHTVALTDVPANCTASGGNSKTVTVPSGGTGHADFTISCVTPTGDLTVTTATTGPSSPSSYTVTAALCQTRTIAANNGSTTYSGLTATDHTVALTDVPTNCTVSGGNSKTVTVPSGGTGHADFTISCVTPTGDLTVTTATTGPSAPSSYTVTVDGGQSRTIAANNGSTTYNGLSATDHTVALTDVPANCTASGGNSKTVTVPSGGTGHADFTITCSAPNQPPTAAFTSSCSGLTCSFTDQSTDPDGSVIGWSWNFGDGATSNSRNPSHPY